MTFAGRSIAQGKGVSSGTAVGPVHVFRVAGNQIPLRVFESLEQEKVRFGSAQKKVVERLATLAKKATVEIGSEEAEIFEAHQMMVQDEELVGRIHEIVESEKVPVESALIAAFHEQIEVFAASDSDYLRGRVLDLQDLKAQLLAALSGSNNHLVLEDIRSPVILVAEDLTPSQTVALDQKNILGIITEKGGHTSHTAIIARAMGVPAVVGVENACEVFSGQAEIAFDGNEGLIFSLDSADTKKYFLEKKETELKNKKQYGALLGKKTETRDHQAVSLFANIGSPKELESVKRGDAEGIGLFRTEFLFMERTTAPTLEEQRSCYAEVLNALAPKEVVIRTLDVGGDKPISYLKFPHEENPFLGMRAVRYCMKHPEFFKTQIQALLLANTQGNLSIMLPMVSRASEVKEVVEFISSCERELQSHPHYAKKKYKLGAMVEIPSLIFELKELAKVVSFISVGTNDLLQYAVAVDRMNPNLQDLYTPHNLGFLRLMQLLAKEALSAGLETGICGELGGEIEFIPLWVAMGFQKLSMTAAQILPARASVLNMDASECREFLNQALTAADGAAVKLLLQKWKSDHS